MTDLVSLLKTLIWAFLLSFFIFRYHKQVNAILSALQKRVEGGGRVKAGPFEFDPPLAPQNAEQQAQKVDDEVSEIVKADEAEESQPMEVSSAAKQLSARELYFYAEDLALREIQAEFNASLSRQMRSGSIPIDGFFIKDDVAFIVEVKYVRRKALNKFAAQAVERILDQKVSYGWRNVRVILAVVYGESTADIPSERKRLNNFFQGYANEVLVRCYSLSELAHKYRISIDGI